MICQECGRSFKDGEQVVPVLTVREAHRYDPMPASNTTTYVHLWHLRQEQA